MIERDKVMVDIKKPTVEGLLGSTMKSGIGLDVAKNHTGIVIWDNNKIETHGFALNEYAKDDYFAEYKMRRDFKAKLLPLVKGRFFQFCVIEDVYGGENFDTVRKLLALQTVIDELIFEHSCYVEEFYRWNEPKWLKYTRVFYKQKGKLKSKVELQGILEYLEFDFYIKNKDLSESAKKSIFFEDICDACGILLSAVAYKNFELSLCRAETVRMSDIKMYYIEDIYDVYGMRDERINEGCIFVELNLRKLEEEVKQYASTYRDDVLCAYVPVDKLGNFGVKNKFEFYPSNEGYLLFYHK